MAIKKTYRANNTYLIEGATGDNPKLMAQALSDGRDSLYLEFYFGFKMVESKNGTLYKKIERETERLGLYLWQAPRTPLERQQNKETIELAKKIRFERGQQLLESAEGYRLKKDREINFVDYFSCYVEKYTKKDVRMVKMAFNRFVDFLRDTPEYNGMFANRIKPEQIDKDMVVAFTEYLQSRSVGEGAHSIYARFKKVINDAIEHDVMVKNPCHGITIKVDTGTLKKDVLSMDEIKQLVSTHYDAQNTEVRRAFIFCLYAGLRWCDVKDLTFASIDYSNRLLKFEQNKTKGHSSASSVVLPLNDTLLKLIGEPTNGKRDAKIFNLPSHTACTKALRRWVARAGIDKHITWHCARHSFAVNILNNGANIKVLASLLGHSGLKHTEKYTRAVDSLKKQAIDSLPDLNI
jgi:site-specific recombinase XerD